MALRIRTWSSQFGRGRGRGRGPKAVAGASGKADKRAGLTIAAAAGNSGRFGTADACPAA